MRRRVSTGSEAISRRLADEWTARERLRLIVETCLSALLVLFVVALALPGPPAEWTEGVETALQKPLVLIPLSAVCASALLWCIRTWVFRKRLRDPGPIQLVSIEDATIAPAAERSNGDAVAGAPVARLATHLRERLSELELTAPTAMPGRPMATDFVELLGTTELDLKQPLAAVGKLLRLVLPTHAYEVKATLLRRDAVRSRGVSIEVTILPSRRTSFRTFWSETWEDALDCASSAIGALVVPLSRRSERGPWCTWHGKALDDQIFDAYQRFQRYSRQRRYEEAMSALYAALRLDPANHHIRFQLGLLQEELALYLDALLTYHSIRRGLEERIGATTDRRERRAFERLELLARYRETFLLGWGERIAEQWVPASHTRTPSKRSRELSDLRDQLRPILVARYRDIEIGAWDREALGFGPGPAAVDIQALLDADPDDDHSSVPLPRTDGALDEAEKRRRKRDLETRQAGHRRLVATQLRLLFQLCARHDVEQFLIEYSGARLRALDTDITLLALRLLPAWARLRAHSARHALAVERERQGMPSEPPIIAGQDRQWPTVPDTVRALWRESAAPGPDPVKELEGSKEFLDHYNAACTFAVPLLQERRSEPRRSGAGERALAAAAVTELECAVRVGGSEKIASQWDWILKEDPDLAGVRAEPAFRRFESERFPSSEPSPVRPSEIVRLVAARHSARLCFECATRLEQQWHRRAEEAAATNAHEALRWWDEEREAWRLARELSLHHRHWQTRLEVIRKMQRFCATHGLGEFALSQPAYASERIDAAPSLIDKAARREMHFAHERIRTLSPELDRYGHDRYCDAWERHLQSIDITGQDVERGHRPAAGREPRIGLG